MVMVHADWLDELVVVVRVVVVVFVLVSALL